MRQGVGIGEFQAGQQPLEGRIPRQIAAQDHRVHEEPDDVLERAAVATGGDGTDHDVIACPVKVQQRREQTVQHDERTDAGPTRQGRQPALRRGVDLRADLSRPPSGCLAARAIRREGDLLRQRPQPVFPPRGPFGQESGIGRCRGARPVVILQRRLGQSWVPPLRAGHVGRFQVAQQRFHGPAVSGDVVQHHDHRTTVPASDHADPHGQFLGEPEHVTRRRIDGGCGIRGTDLVDGRNQGDRLRRGDDPLRRFDARHHHASQRLVTGDDVPECGLQGREVDVIGVDDNRNVVDGRGSVDLLDEPQPALSP